MKERKFKVGDKVEWSSQANGSTKTKRGEIVAIIPGWSSFGHSRFYLANRIPDYKEKYNHQGVPSFLARPEQSYLVAVSPIGKGKPRLYWPRVKALKAVNEKAGATDE